MLQADEQKYNLVIRFYYELFMVVVWELRCGLAFNYVAVD